MVDFYLSEQRDVTISGIELVQKIQKHQFKTGKAGAPLSHNAGTLEPVLAA